MLSSKERKKRYEDRKEKGLCVSCGAKARPGRVQCEKCAEDAKQTKQFYLRLGFCPVCHKYRVYGDEKECPECRARRIVNNRLSTARAWAEGKDWADPRHALTRAGKRYKRLKSEGLCTKCGRRPPAVGRVMCRRCLDKQAERMRRYREDKEKGDA